MILDLVPLSRGPRIASEIGLEPTNEPGSRLNISFSYLVSAAGTSSTSNPLHTPTHDRRRTSHTPLMQHYITQFRSHFHRALLEHLAVPKRLPIIWREAVNHLAAGVGVVARTRDSLRDVQPEYHRAGHRREERRKSACRSDLLVFVEEMEEC